MLREHLSQTHDAASRRFEKIDRHVDWIHDAILKAQPSRILDLGCGPGLYTTRFARLGHTCTGIDFSPASIAHATSLAEQEHLPCTYVFEDIRAANFGAGFDLAMLIFGEFNVFSHQDAQTILQKAHDALADGGRLVLEPHTFAAVQEMGQAPSGWCTSTGGLFSPRPHLCLTENFWDADHHIATERYFIIDAESGNVTRHAASMQAYTDVEYAELLTGCGFDSITLYPSLTGDVDPTQNGLLAVVARKT